MKKRHIITLNLYAALAYRFLLLMFLYTLCRLGFYFFNHNLFQHVTLPKYLYMLWGGLKFDVSALIYINLIFILLQIIPFPFRYKEGYQRCCKWLFIVSNSLGILANFADFAYFKYTLKRTTATVFSQFSNEQNKLKLFMDFLADYWYLFLLYALFIWIFVWLYQLVKVKKPTSYKWPAYVLHTVLLFAIALVCLTGVRGGWGFGTRPITLSNAGEFVDTPDQMSLVLNTPFCIFRTLKASKLKPVNYYDEQTLNSLYNPVHKPSDTAKFKPLNVVFLIIESLGKEHVGSLNTDLEGGKYKGYTPFIDSLVSQSYTFTKTYANGRKSIDALPSVITSIPGIREPFILSIYSGNKTTSIAKLLGDKGYETAFFHGAPNGSMGFSSYTHLAGIKHYFGQNEYKNTGDSDGTWGIWDDPFMQYMAHTMNTFKQPFFSSFFSLSSHHPFRLPDEYVGKFPKGPLPVQEVLGYTDMALRNFFRTASTMPWYKNTLFVLCADHATVSYFPEYQTTPGYFSIPIILYYPGGNLKGKSDKVVQQLDIMPTVLNYLHYDKPYFSFGFDAFAKGNDNFAINNNDGNFNFYQGDYMLVNDGKLNVALYNLKTDRLTRNNILTKEPLIAEQMEKYLKAFVQQYTNRMIDNTLTAP
ncbi:phosphoglycerol transferase MdoB-like AlkP superfamily enzyme [Pedobacter africanus]|uniref:Phosphoglycerol transferase MdoB-like AlkP superfamily enzyme n=1 Tax=Pedobacter africanus TaxID=151894 RepID=A0ACC6L0C5_9SPHI|nr:sulfatase-like hydrolase/transferase [Pedobacter africanus]MDR6784771.1 phosphoglycerol transferase MdoB-like AlkP superfamily enzyme [Pedobacter africanus]